MFTVFLIDISILFAGVEVSPAVLPGLSSSTRAVVSVTIRV